MSVKLMWAAMTAKTGSSTAKLILIKLADNANEKGECWPSIKNIAEQCEVTEKTVITNITKLCNAGLVEKINRFNDSGKTSNLYKLKIESIEQSVSVKTTSTKVNKLHEPSVKTTSTPSVKITHESVSSFESVNESKDMSEAGASDVVSKIKKSSTPYKKIHDLYQKILVETGENNLRLIDVLVLDNERKAKIKSFWTFLEMDIAKVEKYFNWLWDNRADHDWLFGLNKRGWVADIEFICRQKTVRKARENTLGSWEAAA